MKTEIKVIKSLIEKKKETIREIAKQIKADYRITYIAVQRLIEKKIINIEIVGKSILCRLENGWAIEICEAEEERKQSILKISNIKQLYKELIAKVNTSFYVLLLFGSYAKRKQTENSDIDLLFISNEKEFENKITAILSMLPLKTHALVFTEEEFVRMKDAKKPNVVQEAIENNIILYGCEAYNRMKNA